MLLLSGCPGGATTAVKPDRSDSASSVSASSSGAGYGDSIPDFSSLDFSPLNPVQASCSDGGLRVPEAISKGLNIAAFEKRLSRLPARGASFCARGVRESLNALFGSGRDSGPPAKDYNESTLRSWRTKDSCFKLAPRVLAKTQDFDIRVLQPGPRTSQYGHIEIFYKGRWYSDFQQRMSLFGAGYSSFSTYRLSKCSSGASAAWSVPSSVKRAMKLAVEALMRGFVSEAQAAEHGSAPSLDSRPAPARELSAISVRQGKVIWRVVTRTENQGTVFALQKVLDGKKVEVSSDTNSVFVLLELNAKLLGAAASRLADAYVSDWIRQDGRSAVQGIVNQQDVLTVLQRDAYLKQGLKVPPSVEIWKSP